MTETKSEKHQIWEFKIQQRQQMKSKPRKIILGKLNFGKR
jgi:hypothetical protein